MAIGREISKPTPSEAYEFDLWKTTTPIFASPDEHPMR
jgi:hypothetical protein